MEAVARGSQTSWSNARGLAGARHRALGEHRLLPRTASPTITMSHDAARGQGRPPLRAGAADRLLRVPGARLSHAPYPLYDEDRRPAPRPSAPLAATLGPVCAFVGGQVALEALHQLTGLCAPGHARRRLPVRPAHDGRGARTGRARPELPGAWRASSVGTRPVPRGACAACIGRCTPRARSTGRGRVRREGRPRARIRPAVPSATKRMFGGEQIKRPGDATTSRGMAPKTELRRITTIRPRATA